MAVRYGPRVVNQPRVPIQITARSLLLVSSGTVRKCEKESMMAKFKKRMVKWGLVGGKGRRGVGYDDRNRVSHRWANYAGAGSQSEGAWSFLSKRLVAGISRSDRCAGQHAAGEPLHSYQPLLWI